MHGEPLQGYYGTRGAARKLGVSQTWVKELIRVGQLAPVFHVDDYYLIPEKTLERYMAQRKAV